MLDYYPKFDVKNNAQIQDIPSTAIKQAKNNKNKNIKRELWNFEYIHKTTGPAKILHNDFFEITLYEEIVEWPKSNSMQT